MILPFVYLGLAWYLLPTFGLPRLGYLIGMLHSCLSVLSLGVMSASSAASPVCSTIWSTLSSLRPGVYSMLMSAGSLPWTVWISPCLWCAVLLLGCHPPRCLLQVPRLRAPKHSRAFRRAVQQDFKRSARRLRRHQTRFAAAPRLRGRSYHRPHQKPRAHAPTFDARNAFEHHKGLDTILHDLIDTKHQSKLRRQLHEAHTARQHLIAKLKHHHTFETEHHLGQCTDRVKKLSFLLWKSKKQRARCQEPSIHCTSSCPTKKMTEATSGVGGFPVIWDTGASVCVTNDRNDFATFKPDSKLNSLKGFGLTDGHKVEGEGEVVWCIRTTANRLRSVRVPAYYVPDSRVRLLSVTAILREYPGETFTMTASGSTLSGLEGEDATRGSIYAPLNLHSHLPTSIAYPLVNPRTSYSESEANVASLPVVADKNINLSAAEKELLRWHQRLGHIAFRKVQYLMKTGVLAHSEMAKRLHRIACRCNPVKCAACQYAKQRARTAPGTVTRAISNRIGALSQSKLLPGQEVCVDHFICSSKGRLFTSRGKTDTNEMYTGGAIFVDQASGLVHVEFQKSLTTHATIEAKKQFESMCRDAGVVPQTYLSDNGTAFTSQAYRAHLEKFQQIQRFAGVGAHHHNSRAERAIQTIMSISRAMLMHCFLHWPDLEDTSLWPMAVQHAVYLWNHVPNPTTGLCPADVFSRTRFEQSKLLDVHVFGCPVYVLEKAIQDGKKLPRWKPRSQRCMYLGRSASHASSVPLVLNPATGSITPQFHVVFDDWFATVSSDEESLPDFNSPDWVRLFGDSTYQYILDEEDISALRELSDDLENSIDSQNAEFARNRVLEAANQLRPANPLAPPSFVHAPPPTTSWREIVQRPAQQQMSTDSASFRSGTGVAPNKRSASSSSDDPVVPTSAPSASPAPSPLPDRPSAPATPPPQEAPSSGSPSSSPVAPAPASPPPPRRSTRTRVKPVIFDPSDNLVLHNDIPTASHFDVLFSAIHCGLSIHATSAKNNPDILTWDQAMARPDRDLWIKSAEKEIQELESHGCWEEVPLSEAEGHQLVPSQWVFRIKRRPDGSLLKYKGRIVLRGDLMKDIYDVTSPVVAFSTVRLFLAMSLFLGWYTCSVDFSNAFIQAKRPDKVFMKVPRGFITSKPNHCLRLIRNVYGACDGPRLWAQLLFKALASDGFTQSKVDPCLWYKAECFVICFVDDCGICCKHPKEADELIKRLEKEGFSLTKESSFEEFLGIQYQHKANGDVELTQQGLIKKIIEATNLKACNPNKVPAVDQVPKDADGPPMTEKWSYPSIVGMLLYLSTNTRPDITFAVSQVARFTHEPKQSHASAVKTIVRYLAKTIDHGTIVKKPTSALSLDSFVDADFAGLYRREEDKSIDSAKSRAGYIIKLGGCPIIWKSQLIPTICLSTAESEYYALSQSMRALLPLQSIVEEFMNVVDVPTALRNVNRRVHATAHEDNTSALSLATGQRLTSRTRHYHARWHFFWQAVQTGRVEVVYCETDLQDADYLTKPLVFDKFIPNRRRVQGW